MPKKVLDGYLKYVFFSIFVLVALLTVIVIKPFIGAMVAGVFLCYISYPIYKRMLWFVKSENVAAALMTILVLLVIIIPLALVAQMVIVEVMGMYGKVDVQQTVSMLSAYLKFDMQEIIANVTRQALSFMVSLLSSFVLSIPRKLLNIFVLAMTMFVSFRGGERFVGNIKVLLPIKGSQKDEMIDHFKSTTDAIVYGVVVVSLIQGIVAMIAFYIFDVSSPALLGFLTFLAALLPIVGPAVIWVPVALVKYASGNVGAAIGIVIYSIIIQNIFLDLILKMNIIGAKGKIPPLVILLGFVGGVMAFGMVGILLGPVILVLMLEFLKVYLGKNAFTY